MVQAPQLFAELFALVGAIHAFTWDGFSARSALVQNLDSANTFTVTVAGQTITLGPQQQIKFNFDEAGLSTLSVNGTGNVQVFAFPPSVHVETSALSGLTPQNAGDYNITKGILTQLPAPDDIIDVPVLFNSSATKSIEILAVRLNPRFQVTGIAPANTATFELQKTGAVALVTIKVFNDVPGGVGTDPYPGYSADVGTFDFTLSAVAGALVLAPGDEVLATVTQAGASDVTTCELEIHWRVLT